MSNPNASRPPAPVVGFKAKMRNAMRPLVMEYFKLTAAERANAEEAIDLAVNDATERLDGLLNSVVPNREREIHQPIIWHDCEEPEHTLSLCICDRGCRCHPNGFERSMRTSS